MEAKGELSVVIIGAGPRGTSVLERLLARIGAHGAPRRVAIHLVDPCEPGPGSVWRTGQSRHYLMNTQSFFPTLVPDRGVDAPALAGASFDDWRDAQRANPSPRLSAADRDELATLASTDFPSRPLYGRYLQWTFEQLLAATPDAVTVTVHPTLALRVVGQAPAAGFAVVLADGTELAAAVVVLALGHLPSRLGAGQQRLADAAAANGLAYFPPAVPADVDWAAVPAGETVLVRGMGLNFFDVVGQLTEARGGRFEATGGRPGESLAYVPSGREPLIVAASRRGAPYRAKATLAGYYPASVRLRFLGEDAAAAIRERGGAAGFDHDVWPLLHRDAVWAYYDTLARVRPEAVRDGFLAGLDAALRLGDADWSRAVDGLVAAGIDEADRLDLPSLARPFAGTTFDSRAGLDAAVLSHLCADAAGSAAGEDDPVKMAIGALNAGRAVVKSLVADGGITEESWLGELRGWFEGFVEGLASGPPALRVEQLAALVRAGVVHFVGPDPVFTVRDGLFSAESPWVRDTPWTARCLVEALAPANRVADGESELLRRLFEDGLARPRLMLAAEDEAVVTSGLDVTTPPYRPRGASGDPVDGLYVLGLQLSSVQWGTAIAAQAGAEHRSGYRTLLDADAIAKDILG
ncbi:FAD/NAD(P)-binding protein [Specibacter cremeus]|uniref:FAD/NAD(P)-binding protein n=1 Tax=Specibacter cremeus TaxID=1629051 RepID=UPI000F7985B1|nr:FAD/NAD(P)-binding protein [Specibacter cremeus]